MSKNRARVHKALDRLHGNSNNVRDINLEEAKIILFSDHHRGRRDGADDFLNNEQTYLKALDYYSDRGYLLVLLGDVEEFWENPLRLVMKSYQEVLQKEKDFSEGDNLIRIWGNHDDVWRARHFLNKYLGDSFPGMEVYESIMLNFHTTKGKLGEMLLVHGHQGSLASERFAALSRFFVRYIWRYVQKWFNIPLSTPSGNIRLKSDLDMDMFTWASPKSRLLLICGHTHQPVFMSFTHVDFLTDKIQKVKAELEVARAQSKSNVDILELELEKANAELHRIEKDYKGTHLEVKKNHRKPCYFNTGCCSFSDGDITGIEIENGHIRLIKWTLLQDNNRIILEGGDLTNIFSACE